MDSVVVLEIYVSDKLAEEEQLGNNSRVSVVVTFTASQGSGSSCIRWPTLYFAADGLAVPGMDMGSCHSLTSLTMAPVPSHMSHEVRPSKLGSWTSYVTANEVQ
jgi:hypothetical protein